MTKYIHIRGLGGIKMRIKNWMANFPSSAEVILTKEEQKMIEKDFAKTRCGDKMPNYSIKRLHSHKGANQHEE